MKILHIITCLGDGGAEAVLYRLISHDIYSEHTVVSLMDGGKYGPLLAQNGVSVYTLDLPRGRVTVSGLWRLWELIRELRPDVIQTWMYHANLLGGIVGRIAGQRNIVWGIHHSDLVPGESSRKTIFVAQIAARLSRWLSRKIVCCAKRSLEVHAGLGYDAKRMVVIVNGYDFAVFHPDPAAGILVRQELGISRTQPLIGFVARFDPLKDHDTLLRALAELKRTQACPICLLIGTGLDRTNATIVRKIAELGLTDDVKLLGRRNDIPALMNALDLHVMSSYSEAFPNVLAEAMACGTPCVSTNVGDAEVILGGTGLIVPPRDPKALAEAIGVMLTEKDGPHWSDRRVAARNHVVAHYSLETMVNRYRAVWHDASTYGMAHVDL